MSNTNGAQINIKALAEFNISLKSFSLKLSESLSEMERSINTLERDWKDEKFKEFKVGLTGHVKRLQPLADELKRYKEHSEKEWEPVIKAYLAELIAGQ